MRRLAAISILAAAIAASCGGGGPVTGTGGAGGSSSSSSASASSSSSAASSGMGGYAPLPDTFLIQGVVTDGKSPVEGAIVMQGGKDPAFTTGPDGRYAITMESGRGIPTVVAAKVGYRSAGFEVYELPEGDVDLVIRYAAPPDNVGYAYGDPGNGDPAHDNSTALCGHCHTSYVADFQGSAHRAAARDPAVQDLYAGVSRAYAGAASCAAAGGVWRAGATPGDRATSVDKCYLGGGVLPDLNPACGAPGEAACDDPAIPAAQRPTAFGRCADCHAPGIEGAAGGRDLLDASGLAYEQGNHCDVCHHVKDVDLTKPPGVAGALAIQRPSEKVSDMPGAQLLQVLYGPEPDVPNGFMGGSYQPKFREAVFCGGCHEQEQEALLPGAAIDPVRWPGGLPTHSTYSEWAGSAYNGTGATCQFCHMPPDDRGLKNSLDTASEDNAGMTYGFPRAPERLRKHLFRSPVAGAPRLFDGAIALDLFAAPASGGITVTAKIRNAGAGHAIPTGEPMRALLLVVRAEGCGQEFAPSGGRALDDWGGARAEGVIGGPIAIAGNQITWAEGAAIAAAGMVVRAARPTGVYDDYAGVGFFADPTLTAPEKGIEIHAPLGEAKVTAVAGGVITLSAPLAAQAGDLIYLGDAEDFPPADGAASIAIAGRAGASFARTLVDPGGARGVPHHRAVDMVSDNRLLPGASAISTYTFAAPPGCSAAKASAYVLYRPLPVTLARQRGWEARDYVVATASASAALP